MNLHSVFQLSIYSLTALSGLMLAYGEESVIPSGLTPFLCLVAFFFNERYRLVRLNLLWANALGLAALGVTVYEFFGERADARLLAGAHFLVYLIWVVLFQDKHPQQYWWLFALGLLQVAVGTVMTLSGWYGLLMLLYLILALWTMAVFHLYQGALAFHADPDGSGEARPALKPLSGGWNPHAQTTVEDAIQQDIPDRWITSRFVLGIAGVSASGLALGLAMFLLVPRVWLGKGNIFAGQVHAISRTMTGVSNEVRLGHMGRILESVEKVLEVRLYDVTTDRRVSLEEFTQRQGLSEPLFRGSVFDAYDGGRWSSREMRGGRGSLWSIPRGPTAGLIRQEYSMQLQSTNVLYAMRPISGGQLRPRGSIEVQPFTRVLYPRADVRDRIDYWIFSQPYVPSAGDRRPTDFGPRVEYFEDLRFLRGYQQPHLDLPPERLEALKALAAAWTAPDKLIGNERMSPERRRALTIESKLRDSGEFSYTLNMEIQDPERDPVEDFLFNRKSGHCEYYATALALMLRAAGVPSRLVTGFKGAESINNGEYYEVQQRHAHAWVEAYFDDAWIVLDATPAAREESVRTLGSNTEFWKSATNSLSALWSTYVISMSQNRQKETLYDPFTGTVAGGIGTLRATFAFLQELALWVRDQFISPDQLLTGAGAMFLAAIAIVAGIAFAIARRLWSWISGRRGHARNSTGFSRWFGWLTRRWRPPPASRMVVEFYDEFLRLVHGRGLWPRENQTQREFARHVESRLGETLEPAGLMTLPHDVTDLYYCVRFGGVDLPASAVEELEDRMRRLAGVIGHSNGRVPAFRRRRV